MVTKHRGNLAIHFSTIRSPIEFPLNKNHPFSSSTDYLRVKNLITQHAFDDYVEFPPEKKNY